MCKGSMEKLSGPTPNSLLYQYHVTIAGNIPFHLNRMESTDNYLRFQIQPLRFRAPDVARFACSLVAGCGRNACHMPGYLDDRFQKFRDKFRRLVCVPERPLDSCLGRSRYSKSLTILRKCLDVLHQARLALTLGCPVISVALPFASPGR